MAAFIPAMLVVNIGAQAGPSSSLTPHRLVAGAQQTDCIPLRFGVTDYPCWDHGLQLTATEGEGGTALLTYERWYEWESERRLTTTRITLTCLSFEERYNGHIFRASGIGEDGTEYYFKAADSDVGRYDYLDDYLALTKPGTQACGTGDDVDPYTYPPYRDPQIVIAL